MTHPAKQEAQEYAYVLEKLRSECPDEETLHDTVDGLFDLDSKLLAMVNEIREKEMLIIGLKAEMENLQQRKQRLERGIDSLRDVILHCMQTASKEKITSPVATISTRRIPPKLVVDDVTKLTDIYLEQQISYKVRREILKDTLLGGTEVPGAHIEQGSFGLTIRRS